jgi:hypothetical protein
VAIDRPTDRLALVVCVRGWLLTERVYVWKAVDRSIRPKAPPLTNRSIGRPIDWIGLDRKNRIIVVCVRVNV